MSAQTKLELLGLIDGAVADGWPHARACRVLELVDERAHRWRARLRETGTLEDRGPGGGAVHGLLAAEEQAILDLIEEWGPVDRSHRKLAHRGSYTGVVFVSPSTVLRGWCNYFRHGVSAQTFSYLSHYTWHRVAEWIRKRHNGLSWGAFRRLFPGWKIHDGQTELFSPQTVAIDRYRYRGSRIPTPWASNAA